ncbi:MAG: dTDP-4-amino-4,6-dideoxygalactose transaminase, partial [Nocardioidaceae bacterium]|nr:dTDP-4-amino-4,6-dideoxygalactose transaminase [Nocardioidaceae bacterium]
MPSSDIPFNRACVEGAELEYIRQAVDSGHMSTSGPFSKRSIEMLLEWSGAEEVLLTTSCTSALELTSLMLDLQPGDSVIVPSFTFTTTALAFARQGAKLLFCDIEPETLGLDARHLATLLDDTVRAVVPVHYAGVACDVDGIRKALAGRPDVAVIEDNAHGLFASWHDQPLGSLGR